MTTPAERETGPAEGFHGARAMNPDLAKLHPYPFEKLAALKSGLTPPKDLDHIAMSIGEPRHEPPAFIPEALAGNLDGLAGYPMAGGLPELRESIVRWLNRRFGLDDRLLDPDRHVLPVTGTREGLFAFVQAAVDRADNPVVLVPNPFYQIYEGAALLAGAEPVYLNTTEDNGFLPDLEAVDEATWRRCRVLFLCSPGNPTGAVMSPAYLERALVLAERHDFIIAADECYSEIYLDESNPPPGLLEVCAATGRDEFRRCVVFHSLSKRSNVPGLRSGFVAGDAEIIRRYRLYRTYHGCAMPIPAQRASIPAWDDDAHVRDNRDLYRRKFDTALEILAPAGVTRPDGAFYLWMKTPVDDETFARELYRRENVTVLPGRYLSRDTNHGNPGENRVRISLVPAVDTCEEAARRILRVYEALNR